MDEGDREVDVGGVREPEGKGVQSSNGYHRFEVKVTSHGGWEFHDLENFDEKVSEEGTEGHVDHGECDRKWPIVELAVEDVLVVHDDGEAEEDPDCFCFGFDFHHLDCYYIGVLCSYIFCYFWMSNSYVC